MVCTKNCRKNLDIEVTCQKEKKYVDENSIKGCYFGAICVIGSRIAHSESHL